jgi:hypothetical protein
MAQLIEVARRLDPRGALSGFPVAAAEAAKVDPAAACVREQDLVLRGREPIERLERLRLQRNRAVAEPGLRVLEPVG